MTYLSDKIDVLEKQNELLKEANEQLKEKIDTSQVSRLIAENNRLNEICKYWENEHDELAEENAQLEQTLKETREFFVDKHVENEELKQQITQLKHDNNEVHRLTSRLITIITDEHYN